MASRRYTYSTCISFGGDEPTAEFGVEVSYIVHPGAPERGPTYSHGGLPAEPAEIDDIRVEKIDGSADQSQIARFAEDIVDKIYGSDAILSDMLTEAVECDFAEQEAAMERRWEDRRVMED